MYVCVCVHACVFLYRTSVYVLLCEGARACVSCVCYCEQPRRLMSAHNMFTHIDIYMRAYLHVFERAHVCGSVSVFFCVALRDYSAHHPRTSSFLLSNVCTRNHGACVDTHTHTHTQRERERERETERDREREREREREPTYIHTHTHAHTYQLTHAPPTHLHLQIAPRSKCRTPNHCEPKLVILCLCVCVCVCVCMCV